MRVRRCRRRRPTCRRSTGASRRCATSAPRSTARSRPRRRAASSPSVSPRRRPPGLGEKGEARPLSEWRAAFAAVAEEIAAADNAIRDARIKQRDIDREIARLEAERNATPPKKLEVRIDLNADAAAPALLRVTYAVRGARWTPVYDARLDTGGKDRKPSLELIRRAEIVQTTGEDWADVALAVSTVRTAHGGSAPELRPLIVRYPVAGAASSGGGHAAGAIRRAGVQSGAEGATDEPRRRAQARQAEEQEAALDAGGFQVVFRIPGRIAVPAGPGRQELPHRVRDASLPN